MKKISLLFAVISIFLNSAFSQSDLLAQLDKEQKDTVDYASGTFKGTRIINTQSVETTPAGMLQMMISHRFGAVNTGLYNFFGLDDATMRLGLSYAFNDRFDIGYGRSTIDKTYDLHTKYKIFRQKTGISSFPVTISGFFRASVFTVRAPKEVTFTRRLSYTYQLLVARKFSEAFSFQLTPTLIHRNLVTFSTDNNDVFALGAAGRLKISNRIALTGEYWYVPDGQLASVYRNSAAIGFDIETGGHIFQLHFTNSQGMIERQFITETTGNWWDGDIYFGFNLTRVFGISNKAQSKNW